MSDSLFKVSCQLKNLYLVNQDYVDTIKSNQKTQYCTKKKKRAENLKGGRRKTGIRVNTGIEYKILYICGHICQNDLIMSTGICQDQYWRTLLDQTQINVFWSDSDLCVRCPGDFKASLVLRLTKGLCFSGTHTQQEISIDRIGKYAGWSMPVSTLMPVPIIRSEPEFGLSVFLRFNTVDFFFFCDIMFSLSIMHINATIVP